MTSCPEVHEHPEFKKVYNPRIEKQRKDVEKWKRMLKSPSGHEGIGEQLKGDLENFKSAPKGPGAIKTLFIICKDCNKKVIKPNCSFCGTENHSLNDAVLLYIGSHDVAYKEGKKKIIQLTNNYQAEPQQISQPLPTAEDPQI